MKKKSKLIRLTIALSLFASPILVNHFTTAEASETSIIEVTYTVKEADNVWDIARKHNYSNMPLEKFVKQIQVRNDVVGLIYAGQKLYIPVEKDALDKVASLNVN